VCAREPDLFEIGLAVIRSLPNSWGVREASLVKAKGLKGILDVVVDGRIIPAILPDERWKEWKDPLQDWVDWDAECADSVPNSDTLDIDFLNQVK